MSERARTKQASPPVPFGAWLLNLDDVLLNATLMRRLIDAQPITTDAEEFMVSDRGRLERALLRDLYVLIEALQKSPPEYRARLKQLVPEHYQRVQELLADQTRVVMLRCVRDYMSHRDVRRYYDEGRLSPAVIGIPWYRALVTAFAELLGTAMHLVRASGFGNEVTP